MKANEVKITNTENGTHLEWVGEFTLSTLELIKNELEQSLSREGNETLDLSNTTSADVVGVQMAYAWKKQLEKQQRKATVILAGSETIKDLFVKTGITQIL